MLYIGTDDGIYRWFHGTPWPIFHSLQGRAVAGMASAGSGTLVVLDNTGQFWETLNNGMDWRQIPLPDGVERPTALAFAGAVHMATARPFGLYRRPVGLPSGSESDPFAFARKLEDSVFGRFTALTSRWMGSGSSTATLERSRPRSSTNGWASLSVPQVDSARVIPVIRSLVPVADEPGALYASVSGAGLWKTKDAGKTWAACPGLPSEVYAVRALPGGTVALATSDGCWISNDAGVSWADQSKGLEKARLVRAIEVKPDNPKMMLAGAAPKDTSDANTQNPIADRTGLGYALYESKDAGKTWAHVTRGFPEMLESDQITDIRYDPTDTDYAVVSLASGELWGTRIDGAWWEPIARAVNAARVLCATI